MPYAYSKLTPNLVVADVERSLTFYRDVLGMEPREERPGKWSLYFGNHKISFQEAKTAPAIALATVYFSKRRNPPAGGSA